MKRLFFPILILGLLLLGAFQQYKKQTVQTNAAKNGVASVQKELNAVNNEITALRAKQAARQGDADARRTFLTRWNDVYNGNHKSIDNKIRKLVGTRQVEVIMADQSDMSIPLGDQQIKVRQYTRGFQGGYSALLRFLGDFETTFELASIERITFTKSLQQDLQASIVFAIPTLNFNSVAAPK